MRVSTSEHHAGPSGRPGLSVVHLSPYPMASDVASAGVPLFLSRLLPAYRDAGVAFQRVIAQRLNGLPSREHPCEGVEVLRAWRGGRSFPKVARVLSAEAGDLVHLQHEVFLYGGPAASIRFGGVVRRSRGAGRPAVVTIHGVVDLHSIDRGFAQANGFRIPAPLARRALKTLIGSAANAADAVIVHDEMFRERLVGQYGVPEHRVNVLPLPVPEPSGASREEARAALALKSPMALFFGFVTGYKGLPLLLSAWEIYRRQGGQSQLVVAGGRHPRLVGDREYERQYSELMNQAARAGGVDWRGYLSEDQAALYLAAADALVLPYRDALAASGPLNFGLAYGVPILASDVLSPLAPSVEGVFPRHPEALAQLLAEVLDGPKGVALAAASRLAAEEASLPRVASRTVALYKSLL